MKNELQRHKKSDCIKWAITAIVLLLLCTAVIGICLQLFGNGKQKPSEWFKKPDTVETEQSTEVSDGKADDSADGESAAKVALKVTRTVSADGGISAQANDDYVVTATVLPETATNKTLVWDVRFKNTGTSSSNGKTASDYVEVWQSEDTLTGTVRCKQAFSEPIVIHVNSEVNEAVYTEFTCYYRQKAEGMSYSVSGDIDLNSTVTFSVFPKVTTVYTAGYVTDYSVLRPTCSMGLKINPDFAEALSDFGYDLVNPRNVNITDITTYNGGATKTITLNEGACKALFGTNVLDATRYRERFISAVKGSGIPPLMFSATLSYDGLPTLSQTYYLNISTDALAGYSSATSVTVSSGDIVF